MKNKNTLIVSLLLFTLSAFIYSGCRKSDRETDTETQSSHDNTIAEYTFADAFGQIVTAASMQADLYSPAQTASTTSCPTITISPAPPISGFPKVLTIDFGAAN